MNEEIMLNELIEDTTDEIAIASSGKGLKVAAGVGLAIFGGVITYKYVIKPVIAKIKTKKEQQRIDAEIDNFVEIEE